MRSAIVGGRALLPRLRAPACGWVESDWRPLDGFSRLLICQLEITPEKWPDWLGQATADFDGAFWSWQPLLIGQRAVVEKTTLGVLYQRLRLWQRWYEIPTSNQLLLAYQLANELAGPSLAKLGWVIAPRARAGPLDGAALAEAEFAQLA